MFSEDCVVDAAKTRCSISARTPNFARAVDMSAAVDMEERYLGRKLSLTMTLTDSFNRSKFVFSSTTSKTRCLQFRGRAKRKNHYVNKTF